MMIRTEHEHIAVRVEAIVTTSQGFDVVDLDIESLR